ncbi:MAG: ribosome biogenesis GTPase YlqF [Oscillospiraceae bacterium]|nr:ribosome biogenesis GTPase YlqF [Oscillospiraceae bacterium]
MNIQWFPGHMAKTRRLMRDNLKLVDIVAELRDARIPHSSANPEIDRLCAGKPRVLLLCKADLADESITRKWKDHFAQSGLPCLAVDCRSGKGLNAFEPLVREALAPLLERRKARGMVGGAVRVMVAGVPNVGKSSLINRLSGGKPTKVEDRPGVTRTKQWVAAGGLEVLDMPGVLWHKFDDPEVGENLAFTGAVKDDILDTEALAARLLERLAGLYPQLVAARYKLDMAEAENLSPHDLLRLVGKKRGMLLPGNEIDSARAAIMLLDEYRGGVIGRMTLERGYQ